MLKPKKGLLFFFLGRLGTKLEKIQQIKVDGVYFVIIKDGGLNHQLILPNVEIKLLKN